MYRQIAFQSKGLWGVLRLERLILGGKTDGRRLRTGKDEKKIQDFSWIFHVGEAYRFNYMCEAYRFNCMSEAYRFNDATSVVPRSAGDFEIEQPAARRASNFASAVSFPPVMIAPA